MTTRTEKVVLSLDSSNFTTAMAKAAAATAVLDRALDKLDGQTVDIDTDVDGLGRTFRRAGSDLDSFTGRLGFATKAALAFGPALAPIGAVAVPAVAGLAGQLGFAAVAAGTATLAFQGIGEALESVSKAQLDPTTENLDAMRVAMAGLTPAGRNLVTQLQDLRPIIDGLRSTASESMFPGLVSGLQDLERIAPEVNAVVRTVSTTLGDLAAAAGDDLASGRWDDFFKMLANEARPALSDMGSAIGSVVHGLSELWEAFAPLNQDVGSWLADAARGFDQWATGLSRTDGFKEFLDYVRTNGPKVADMAVAVGDAILQIAEAAATLGGPILEALTGIAKAIGVIADSPLGPVLVGTAAAMSAASLATRGYQSALAGLGLQAGATSGILATIGQVLPAAVVATSVPELISLQDTWQRSNDAAKATADTYTELASALQSSNVGKFAAELGIDVNQLASDLVMFGENGTYVQEVLSKLEEGSEGFGNNVELLASDALPFWTAGASKAWEANDDLGDIIANNTDLLGKGRKAMDQAGQANERFAAKSLIAAQRLAQQRAAARQSAAAMVDWGNSLKPKEFSLDGWLDQIEKQIQAMRDLRVNAQRAGENGVRDGLIKHLKGLGTQGALQLEHLADASRDMVNRANKDWGRYREETRRAGQDVERTGQQVDNLGRKKANPKIGLDDDEFRGKHKGAKGDLDGANRWRANPIMGLDLNPLRAGIATANSLLNGIPDETVNIVANYIGLRGGQGLGPQRNDVGVATGGHIRGPGTSTSDSIPARLSDGEYVIKAAAVDKYGVGTFDALNAMRPAKGDLVGAEKNLYALASGGMVAISWAEAA